LFDWANDPEVRENAFDPEPVKWEEHVKWFNEKLANPSCFIFILIADNIEFGQVRFDLKDGKAEVDISIDSKFRGKGYGTEGLKVTSEYILGKNIADSVVGLVKKSNIASQRAFEKAGFQRLEEQDFIKYLSTK
jgi:UDP-2,4-diacetamido-2,4,6-trideoxy-beta-L-altropyranose hydrolase